MSNSRGGLVKFVYILKKGVDPFLDQTLTKVMSNKVK